MQREEYKGITIVGTAINTFKHDFQNFTLCQLLFSIDHRVSATNVEEYQLQIQYKWQNDIA